MDSESMLGNIPRKERSLRPPVDGTRSGSPSLKEETLAQDARAALIDAGLLVANSMDLNSDANGFAAEIDGDFCEFAKIAKELGVRVVFFEAAPFDDGDFQGENDEGELLDLREIEPKLRDFEQYLGCCHLVRAVAPFSGGRLVKHDCTDWYTRFSDLRDRALSEIAATATEEREERDRLFQQRQNTAQDQIRALIEDDGFRDFMRGGRRTLQGIVAYIRENIDEAQYLSSGAVRDQARYLKDRFLLQD